MWFHRFTAGEEFCLRMNCILHLPHIWLEMILRWDFDFGWLLERDKTLGPIGMEWIYFACEEDMNFGSPEAECYGLNVCVPPPKACVQNLMLSMMTFGDGVFGRKLGLDEVIREGPAWWDYCLHKMRHQRTSLSCAYKEAVWAHRKIAAPKNQENASQQNIPWWHLDLRIPNLQCCGK